MKSKVENEYICIQHQSEEDNQFYQLTGSMSAPDGSN
jgi:hypothetical protein